ncbi:MAG: hypothetical protein AAF821_08815 [Cyanobacteria bacterium P01_D01_bin.156]
MLGKLLGKKSGYYLELSEEEISAIPEPVASPAAAPQAASPEPESVGAAPTAAAPTPKTVAAPALASSISKAAAAMPQEAATPGQISDPVELIRTAIAAAPSQAATEEVAESSEPEFDYRAPIAKASRRRPGPSMSPFKTMAKDMKRTPAGF